MKNSVILLEGCPRGKLTEGYIYGTPYPGTLMTIKAATEPIGGRFTWEPFNRDANANRALIAVLLEDSFNAGSYSKAYVTGSRCRLYIPVPGDELNMLVSASGTGTGDSIAIGDLLIPVDGTGLLIATASSPEIEPFQALETQTDVAAAGTLTHCLFTGY